MDFRKIIFFWMAIFFANRISAQMDSTDLDFHTNQVSLQTSEDSLLYGSMILANDVLVFSTEGFGELVATFNYSYVVGSSKVTYEIFYKSEDLIETSVFAGSYNSDDLDNPEYSSNDVVSLPICNVKLDQTYTVVLQIEDQLGHVISSIFKTVTL